jgi:hypothetical protein
MRQGLHNISIFIAVTCALILGTQLIYAAWEEPAVDPPAGNPALNMGGGSGVFEEVGSVVRQGNTPGYDEDFVFGSPQLADDTITAHDSRMWFDKSKGAFRAGYADMDDWEDAKVGEYSFVGGYRNMGSGRSSFAVGEFTWATGLYSFTGTYDTWARGESSVALGGGVWVYDDHGISLGRTTRVHGDSAVAIGSNINTNAEQAMAFGKNIQNDTMNSFMVGFGSSAPSEQTTNPGLFVDSNNNVGIKTSTITSGLALDVEGKVGATEFCTSDGSYCFDAQVASTTISNLYTDVSGNVGAQQFCDETGANCFTAADIAALIAGGGGGSVSGGGWSFISRANGTLNQYEGNPSGSIAIPEGARYAMGYLEGYTTEGSTRKNHTKEYFVVDLEEMAEVYARTHVQSSSNMYYEARATVADPIINLTSTLHTGGSATGHLGYDFYFYAAGSGGGGTAYFGDASDGDVTIPSSLVLSRDMYYDNLTIPAGVTVDTNGYRIFVQGDATISGTLRNNGSDGGDGGDATGGFNTGQGAAGIAGLGAQGNTLPGGIDGVNGAGGSCSKGYNGLAGRSVTGLVNNGRRGGIGGGLIQFFGYTPTGDSAGGAGGTLTPSKNKIKDVIGAYNFFDVIHSPSGTTFVSIYPTAGGGSGGSGSGSARVSSNSGACSGGGGASGGSGGIVMIFAKNLTITAIGRLQANGGNGGDAGTGRLCSFCTSGMYGGSGGGAGGNGGVMVLVYGTLTNNGVIEASGGAGGLRSLKGGNDQSALRDGTNGENGLDGTVLTLSI